MNLYDVRMGDIFMYPLPKTRLSTNNGEMKYGKVIAIFSDGLLFLENANKNNWVDEEYDELYFNEVNPIPINTESLINLGFTEDDSGNYVKETIDKKGKVVISENNSYIELADSKLKALMSFSLYSISNVNTIHMLQKAVRDLLDDDKKFYLPKVCGQKLFICPFKKGDKLGVVRVEIPDFDAFEVPLLAVKDVPELGFFGRLKEKVKYILFGAD